MNLLSDSLHNFTDGLLIATSFVISKEMGIATTIAVLAHEIPQEISDFALILHSGYSKKKALWLNFLAGSTTILAAVLFFLFGKMIHNINDSIIPIVTGTFLYYIAFCLIPEIVRNTTRKNALSNIVFILLGIVLIGVL
jgi:zinc and cadmium transporter